MSNQKEQKNNWEGWIIGILLCYIVVNIIKYIWY